MEKTRVHHLSQIEIKYVILDLSCVNYVDSQGVKAILNVRTCSSKNISNHFVKIFLIFFKLYESFKEVDVAIYFSYCKSKFYFI